MPEEKAEKLNGNVQSIALTVKVSRMRQKA